MPRSETAIAEHEQNAAKLPQSKDDSYDLFTGFLVGTEDTPLHIDVSRLLANDLGGNAESVYGLASSAATLLTTEKGGTVSLHDGILTYTPPPTFDSLVGSNDPQSSVQGIGWETDTFTYTIQLGDGALSTATVTLRINGGDDLAIITGDDTGSVKEETKLTDAGTLIISDLDTGQVASFQSHDATNPLVGEHGTLTIDAGGNWTYLLNNNDPAVQGLTASQNLSDTITVHATDGATHDITISIAGTNEYQYVGGFFTYAQAQAGAAAANGYLATITSEDENQLLFNLMTQVGPTGSGGWLGGSDAAAEGTWAWINGPEAGTVFWNGLSDGGAPAGQYTNWEVGEPNQWLGSNEDGLLMWWYGPVWNDGTQNTPMGYFVEIGA
jgi:VCBS repeat-containing protein